MAGSRAGAGEDPPKAAGKQSVVRAAGVVVLRAGATGAPTEVLVVHRPRYDDWSLPKGKLERGEHPLVAAVREVLEETGVRALPGRFLTRTHYLDPDGRPKTVDWWLGAAAAQDPRAGDDEVDEQRWLPLGDAPALLSHSLDTDLLAMLGPAPVGVPEPALVLLRHASARSRKSWAGADPERPLNRAGEEQAHALVGLLAALRPARVHSSSALRCQQTVAPYLAAAGLVADLTDELTEEAGESDERRPAAALRAIADATSQPVQPAPAAGPQVVCTHRPVLELLLTDAAPGAWRPQRDDPLKTAEIAVLTGRYGEMSVDRYLVPQPESPSRGRKRR